MNKRILGFAISGNFNSWLRSQSLSIAKDFQRIGYSEYRMTTGHFVVTYRGSRSVDPEDVNPYAFKEVC
ncbi:MAG: hypothetical protein P0S93_04525 [Candidatus Neptunochlamydia sp.]|nr:hypothetical protein [Candidatus Neptunochlamydia sp.]